MTHYVLRLSVTLSHAYYGTAPIPLRMVPARPDLFDKSGLLLKQRGNRTLIVAEEEASLPDAITFDVIATDPDVFSVTRFADWGRVLHLSLPETSDEMAFGPATVARDTMRSRLERIAQVTIAMGRADLREVTLRFDAVEAIWAYHMVGPGSHEDLQIVDSAEHTSFSPQGRTRLPDGTAAQVIRSDTPLPARARPSQKFMLQRPSPFGPETLIPVLPAAGKMFKPIPTDDSAGARLQSDIYVTLW